MSGHGGNIYAASRRTGIPEEKILDFSASINPLGMPKAASRAIEEGLGMLFHYPEPYSEELCLRIARHLSVDPKQVVCGNGSTELIYLVPRVLRPRRVLIPGPTFGEYERASVVSGALERATVLLRAEDRFDLPSEAFMAALSDKGACDMAFMCNPNNPTGRLVDRESVLACADAAKKAGCYLVVDEAFIDFCPEASVCEEVGRNPYLIVLRSMTKFYALSGLRIGYGLFHTSLAETMRAAKEPWTVNSLAQRAALASLADPSYAAASLESMKKEKAFMETKLKEMGVWFLPSRANYYLIRHDHAQEMRAGLEKKGILVRDCAGFAGLDETYLRIAVRSRKENEILLEEMAAICARS